MLMMFLSATIEQSLIAKNNKSTSQAKILYLDLIKKSLINHIYQDAGLDYAHGEVKPYDSAVREQGKDWPVRAHTMIGLKRLDNLQACIESVLKNNVPGDLIETGVWRGGATILMRAVLKAYGVTNRNVWVADSFQGLPKPDTEKYPEDSFLAQNNIQDIKELAVGLEEVKSNFRKYDLLDGRVKFLKGWFKDTLPSAPIKKLAVLRLDGDLYESTILALRHLYPKLSIGGYVIIDDYNGLDDACKKAVNYYRKKHHITEPIIKIDSEGIFWQKKK